jgi:hypothetical protein
MDIGGHLKNCSSYFATVPYLIVPTRLDANEAYDLFERLDREWWLEASERAQFRMNIVPEFL